MGGWETTSSHLQRAGTLRVAAAYCIVSEPAILVGPSYAAVAGVYRGTVEVGKEVITTDHSNRW